MHFKMLLTLEHFWELGSILQTLRCLRVHGRGPRLKAPAAFNDVKFKAVQLLLSPFSPVAKALMSLNENFQHRNRSTD